MLLNNPPIIQQLYSHVLFQHADQVLDFRFYTQLQTDFTTYIADDEKRPYYVFKFIFIIREIII